MRMHIPKTKLAPASALVKINIFLRQYSGDKQRFKSAGTPVNTKEPMN